MDSWTHINLENSHINVGRAHLKIEKQTFYCFFFVKHVDICMLLLLFHNFCSGNSLNLACSLLLVPGIAYWEQAQVSLLFHVNCSRNNKYGTYKKTCCSPYLVPGTLFREQKRCTRPIHYNFAYMPPKTCRHFFFQKNLAH